MKTLCVALAVVSLLATSAVAKQTRAPRGVPDSTVIQHNDYLCAFHYARIDPDPGIRFELRRDCKNYLGHGGSD